MNRPCEISAHTSADDEGENLMRKVMRALAQHSLRRAAGIFEVPVEEERISVTKIRFLNDNVIDNCIAKL